MKSADNFGLSVVIPCLDEADNVCDVLDKLMIVTSGLNFPVEIVVVDDLSQDKTYEIALNWFKENPGVSGRVVSQDVERRGYGAVLRRGVACSSHDLVTFISADLVDPIEVIREMYDAICDGADLVQCNRHFDGFHASIPFRYRFFQTIYRVILQAVVGKKYDDSTYSFKMFKKTAFIELGIHMNGFAIGPEIFLKHLITGKTIEYVFAVQGERSRGSSKFSFLKEGFGYIYCLLRAGLHKKRIAFWV